MAKKKAEQHLQLRTNVKTLIIKICVEQCTEWQKYADDWESKSKDEQIKISKRLLKRVLAKIRKVPRAKINRLFGILHDRDPQYDDDGMYSASIDKPHIHICVQHNEPIKISTIFNLLGINGKRPEDKSFWENGAIQHMAHLESSALYATHETAAARHKEKYRIEEVYLNFPLSEFQALRDKALRAQEGREENNMITKEDMSKEAEQLGYARKDFNAWWRSKPYQTRIDTALRNDCREAYQMGVDAYAEDNELYLPRLSIYISGDYGVGKTYTTIMLCKAMGLKTYVVDGGETGAYDGVKPYHDALIIDDYTGKNLLNIADRKPCHLYRRNKNNPWWLGSYYIVLGNESFPEWAVSCSKEYGKFEVKKDEDTGDTERVFKPTDKYKAAESRFFICDLRRIDGHYRLECSKPFGRGSKITQLEMAKQFAEFRDKFNEAIYDYEPLNPAEALELRNKVNAIIGKQVVEETIDDDEPESGKAS